jgi:hypothetical protein
MAVVKSGIPRVPCWILNIYVTVGCCLKRWCTWVRIETCASRKTGNSAVVIFAPSTCLHLELHTRLHARCMPRRAPQLGSGFTAAIFCPPIPVLTLLEIRRKGQCDSWLIEIVDVYHSSIICCDMLYTITWTVQTQTYGVCLLLIDLHITWVAWMLTCGVCVVAVNCVQTSFLLEEWFVYHIMHELVLQYPV